jgi:hypothetical protein
MTVGEEVHCRYKKFVADLEQKKGAIAAFFQLITNGISRIADIQDNVQLF